jgi:hypothetical protein
MVEPPPEAALILTRRINAKSCIMEKLRAGELTLLDAAGWFRRLNAEPPTYPDHHWQRMPGDTPDEKICHQVIRWVDAYFYDRAPASEVAALIHRLEKELQDHRAANGTVKLPGFND